MTIITGKILAKLTNEIINEADVRNWLTSSKAGAVCTFLGTARDYHEGKKVLKLEYEGYEKMALLEMEKIALIMLKKWELEQIAIIHRLGVVPIQEVSVIVGISSVHREEAFLACKYGIDQIKVNVPIWKKEYYEGGEHWVGSCC